MIEIIIGVVCFSIYVLGILLLSFDLRDEETIFKVFILLWPLSLAFIVAVIIVFVLPVVAWRAIADE